MSGASALEGRAVVEDIVQALGDDVAPESETWWQYLYVVKDVGPDCARQLVGEVDAVEPAGGMTTRDGSRRRTRGGVFFALAYKRLGARRAKSVHWRATRRVHEEALRRFLRLLALALPVSPEQSAASPESAMPAPELPAPVPSAPATARSAKLVPPAREPAATAPATQPGPSKLKPAAAKPVPAAEVLSPKPARRQEPEVEVLVVRRRPAADVSPAAKPGPSTPRTGT